MNGQRNRQSWPVRVSVWLTFVVFGAVTAPVPGVNEPHYLCKARHYWQPDWCSQDFFLVSPNAHTVFFATIGSLTNFVSLEQSAWIGRILAMIVLTWGWMKCLSQLLLTQWASLWCAWIFLALTACGNFSGEWLIGGVEGKVLCYGFLLAAYGDVLRNRWLPAATWAGFALSFHPVVGIWGLLAFLLSQLFHHVGQIRKLNRTAAVARFIADGGQSLPPSGRTESTVARRRLFRVGTVLPWLVLIALALPGLIPVVKLLMEPVSAETRFAGTYLQVYFRLAHHLDPMMFPVRAYLGYAFLLVIWLSSFAWGGRNNSKRAFDQIVLWAVVFAVTGIFIGLGSRPAPLMSFYAERMNLLKFYPFRLADALVPIAVAVSLVSVLERTAFNVSREERQRSYVSIPHVVIFLVFLASLWRAFATSETNRYAREDRTDWLDVCHWIDAHLPANAIVQTPTNGWAFKWFAHRAEFVAFKDCPQDSAGIVEWNRRLNFLQHWYEQNYVDGLYSASELKELRRQTGITHLLTDRLGPLELEPIYRNGTFQVYDLTTLDR